MEFTFTLAYQLHTSDVDALIERLADAGCDDAHVGVGQPGCFSIEFMREAGSAAQALKSAIADVFRAVPEAKLIEAKSNLVGLRDADD